MADQTPCDICRNQAEYELVPPRVTWRCPRCGAFRYDSLEGPPRIRSPDDMVRLSGWVREQNADGLVPVQMTRETWHRVIQRRLPKLRERADLALSVIARRWPSLGATFDLDFVANDLEVQGRSYSRDAEAALVLTKILNHDGYFQLTNATGGHALSVKGLLAAEALSAGGSGSQGFVAMWFDDSTNDAWLSGFEPGISAAGFRARRIDQKDYVGGVSDEIMAEIRQSRFVVADYTGQRNGVYFEVGFAVGLGLTVIPTCHAAEIGKLHFDIRHLNTLEWSTPADLADKLNKRIRAVVGFGPNADPG